MLLSTWASARSLSIGTKPLLAGSPVFLLRARPDCTSGAHEANSHTARVHFAGPVRHNPPADSACTSVLKSGGSRKSRGRASQRGILRRSLQFLAEKCQSGL